MAGDFNKPAVGDSYTAFAQAVRDIVADVIKGLDPALTLGTLNTPTNAIRWNSANKYWEKYNGSTWAAMSSDYAITITGSAAKWTTGRTITLTGAVTGTSGAFDGSGNLSFSTTLATVAADKGGTGITSYTIGDIIYASGTTTIAKLSGVATGNALISGGVGAAPAWGKIGLTTHVTGTLPVGNGGTGATTLTGIVKGNGTGAFTAASAAEIVAAIGSTAVANATSAASATYAKQVPSSSTSGTLVVGDVGKCVSLSAGITVPASTFAAGDAVSLYNNTSGNLTITQGSGLTLRLAGTAGTGNRALAQRGMATLWFVSATEAVISGGGLT